MDHVKHLAQRLIYSSAIAAYLLVRPSILALPHLGLLFWLPHVPFVARRTDTVLPPTTRYFLRAAIGLSVAVLLGQSIVQLIFKHIHLTGRCNSLERQMIQLGLPDVVSSFQPINLLWLLPDVLMLLISIGMYFWLHCVADSRKNTADRRSNIGSLMDHPLRRSFGRNMRNASGLMAMLSAAVVRPSVLGAVYFAVFLGVSTWWAFDRRFGGGRFAAVLWRMLQLMLVVHITLFVVHQLGVWQSDSLCARLLGFDSLVSIDCVVDDGSRVYFQYKANRCSECWLNPCVLIAWYLSFSPMVIKARVTSDDAENSTHQPNRPAPPAGGYSEQLVNCLRHCSNLMLANFYIVNNIVMMVWSIVFHGWLTFVYLLWANVLWIVPDTRRRMMLCTPLIVGFAQLLLVVQYAVSLNVHRDEMAAALWTLRVHEQLGLVPSDRRWLVPPLLVQTLFTGFFWVSLHQHRVEQRTTTTTSDERCDRFADVRTTDWVTQLGVLLRQCLLKLWIWMVMVFVLVMAIMGDRVTAIRVVYMVLFVGFVVTFQVSSSGSGVL